MTDASIFTGRVPYAVYGFFASVLCIARCIVYGAFFLVKLAFGFKFLVAGDAPSYFLSLAGHFICRAFLRVPCPCATSVEVICVYANKGQGLREAHSGENGRDLRRDQLAHCPSGLSRSAFTDRTTCHVLLSVHCILV